MGAELSGTMIGFYLLLGLVAGIFSAMFGIGSGIILVPMLTLVAMLTQKEAQGIALAVMIPMALMGVYRYHMNPNITLHFKIVVLIAVTSVVGANIGASLAAYFSNKTLQIGFSIIMFVIAIRMFFTAIGSKA